MRIACIYLPSFPLQAHIRQAPHLAGAPLAVADGAATGSVIMACSRAAWAEGIRPGMPASTARSIAPDLSIVASDPVLYERALAALSDSLMGLCDTVDLGPASETFSPHRAVYVSVPPRMRGASFGQKLLGQLSRQGFRGRVGVADDRFTAYVAAVLVDGRNDTRLDAAGARPPMFHQSCTSVPRGGSAAFLAPLPLGYLPIDPDVQRMLHTCGVKTLGDFAALPPPSVSRPWAHVDFQALARGAGPAALHGMSRDAALARAVVERMDLAAGEPAALAMALRTVCDRACLRLEGRERGAMELLVRLLGPGDQSTELVVPCARPTACSRDLLDAIELQRDALELQDTRHQVVAVELVVVAEAMAEAPELELFTTRAGLEAHSGTGADMQIREPAPASSGMPRPAPVRMGHQRPRHGQRRVPHRRPLQQHLFDG
jgi:protein ImuB